MVGCKNLDNLKLQCNVSPDQQLRPTMMGYPQPPILSLLLLLLLLLLLFLPFLLQLLHILLLLPLRIPNLPLPASAGASAQDLGLELVGLSAISPSRHKTLAIFFLFYKIIFPIIICMICMLQKLKIFEL